MRNVLDQQSPRLGTKVVSGALLAALTLAACGSDAEQGGPSGRIYASVAGSHEVLVIDDQSHEIVSSIPVGDGPAILVGTPDQKKLYSANWRDDSVSAITLETEDVTNIALPGRPYVIAMAPQGDMVYAGLDPTGIAVIDTASDEVVRTFATGDLAASLIVSPDGKTLYVAALGLTSVGGTLRAISTETGKTTQPALQVGAVPAWITITPDGSAVYTLNFLSDDVSVVDTAAWKVVATVSTGKDGQGIIGNVTPDGEKLYVTNYGLGNLVAMDTKSHALTQTIELTGRPVGVNFSPDGTRVYTTDFGTESLKEPAANGLNFLLTGHLTIEGAGLISVFDVASGEPVGEPIRTDSGPTSLVIQAR
jgi:YVTN family beta-propeller protein